MKVYIVMEDTEIAGQDCEKAMCVFSSNKKASEAIKEYVQRVNDPCLVYDYYQIERGVYELW